MIQILRWPTRAWLVTGALIGAALLTGACGGWGARNAPPQPSATTIAVTTIAATSAPTIQSAVAPAALAGTPSPQPEATPIEAAREVDFAPLIAVIEQEMASQQVPGLAIAVIQHGVPRFSRGFGLADIATGTEVTPSTLFRIGSITKPLTAIALMQLVEAGQVNLDAPVSSYVPEFVVNPQITLRQLLSHSSGLGDAAIPYGRTDPAALQDYVASLNPSSAFAPPGMVFSYSNTGFNVLGRVVEVVSGMAYADYMAVQVFPILGMSKTTFRREAAQAAGLALGYYPTRNGPQLVDRDPDNGAEYPSGFAFSSVEELTRLALLLLNGGMLDGEQRLSPAAVQEMTTPVIGVEPMQIAYGLGLLIRGQGAETITGHHGTINGYAATMQLMPSQGVAVIVLSNRNNYDPAKIVQAAFALFVEPPAKQPAQEISLDEAALAAYAGRYIMSSALPGEPAEEVIVAMQGGRLSATLPGVTFSLRAVGDDLFDVYEPGMDEPMTQLAFLRDGTGAIQYMSFTLHALRRQAE